MLNRSIPLRDQVYSLVRGAIVTGKLAPGVSINELEIAANLGISRTPVRKAVKKVSD
jgi:DNA-binding GntR family transcriptional regulator